MPGSDRRTWAPGAAPLAAAAQAVERVAFGGRSAEVALGAGGVRADRAAVQAITLGTLRWYLRLVPALERLLPRPSSLDPLLRALLAVAAHQVEYSRGAREVSVHAAVDAVRALGLPRAVSLANAVLRRFVAEREQLLAAVDSTLEGRTAHPAWLVRRLTAVWGAQSREILEGGNQHPPMVLRVDLSRGSRESFKAELDSHGIDSSKVQWSDSAIVLTRPRGVADLPGFAEGRVSVQDAGAQLAALLLDARPGQRVLDACAAPGGKTGHILERADGRVDLTAIDVDAARVEMIRDNLRRLGRTARVQVGDMLDPSGIPFGETFDRILVDAPCSSTGVIRRHPDIKLLRRESDLPAFAASQRAILRNALSLLAPGGRLLYATCSVLPQENEAVIEEVLSQMPEVAVAPMPPLREMPPGTVARTPGFQLLPGTEAGSDGFYYACLEKATS